MDFSRTNWLAVVACVVAGVAVGFCWYGVLFNQQWMDGNGITMDETQTKIFKDGVEQQASMTPMALNAVAILVYALLMNWLLGRAGAQTWQSGATVGGVVGIIMCLGVFVGNMFAFVPTSLSMVDGSYVLVMFTVLGAILGGWQKK